MLVLVLVLSASLEKRVVLFLVLDEYSQRPVVSTSLPVIRMYNLHLMASRTFVAILLGDEAI